MQAVCNKWIMIELMSFIIQVFSLIELHGQCMMAVSIDCGWHIVSRYCICCDQLTVVFSVTTLMDCLWLNNGRIINRRQASKDSLSRLYFRDRGRDLFKKNYRFFSYGTVRCPNLSFNFSSNRKCVQAHVSYVPPSPPLVAAFL